MGHRRVVSRPSRRAQRLARERAKIPRVGLSAKSRGCSFALRAATLRAVGATDATQAGWDDFLLDSEPSLKEESSDWWQLRDDVRRETFQRIDARADAQAWPQNTERSDDELHSAR